MWDPELSPRTPILFEHWLTRGQFDFSPESFPNGSNVIPVQLYTEDFHAPHTTRDGSYVIIPLHSPPKPVQDNNKRSIEERKHSSPSTSVAISSHNDSQVHRRSPEKRFSSPGPICRICHEGDLDETLLSPCNCNGSLLLVHKSCLEKWLSTSNSDRCEICMIQLPVRKEARPVWQWFGNTSSTYGPQGFYADLTCVILLTPICLLSIYLCAIGAADYMKHGIWEGTGLAILSGFLLCTYFAWCYITIRFHWKTLMKWRTSNQVIHLVEKECRKNNVIRSQVSDSATPRSTMISSSGWRSPPQVLIFSQNVNMEQPRISVEQPTPSNETNSDVDEPHPLDMSLQNFAVPAFL